MDAKLFQHGPIKAGDVIGFSGDCWQSWGINLVTRGWPWWPFYSISHVGIMAEHEGELLLFESTTLDDDPCVIQGKPFKGTQAHRLQTRLDSYPGRMWHYPLYRSLYDDEYQRLTEFLHQTIGIGYDCIGAFRAGDFAEFSRIESWFRETDLSAIFCSEWCAAALATTGPFATGKQGTESTDTTAGTAIVGAFNFVLGGTPAAASFCGCTIEQVRITHGVVAPANFLTGNETKTPLSNYLGYAPPAALSPASVGNLVMWLGKKSDGGRQFGTDFYGGWDAPRMPAARGTGLSTYREPITGKLFKPGQSLFRGWHWSWDNVAGYSIRHSYMTIDNTNFTAGGYKVTSATMGTTLDYIQNTGVFTICGRIKFHSDTGATQLVIDNGNSTSGNNGFTVNRATSTNKLGFRIGANGSNIINESPLNGTIGLSNNQWYFFAITSAGYSPAIVKSYIVALPGNLLPATVPTGVNLSGTITDPGGAHSYASTQPFNTCQRADDAAGTGADMSTDGLLFYSTALSQADLQVVENALSIQPAGLRAFASTAGIL